MCHFITGKGIADNVHSRPDSWLMFVHGKIGQLHGRPNYPAYSENDVWPIWPKNC